MKTMHIADQKDDIARFEEMFRQFYKPLYNFALRMLRDDVVADDIVQDVFCAVWDKRSQVDFSIPIKSYLYRAVHNRCLNAINDRRNHVNIENGLSEEELTIFSVIAQADDLEIKDMQNALSEGIHLLPERCKEIFQLSRLKSKKNREIAEELGISVKAVEKQITKALLLIREHLKSLGLLALASIVLYLFR